METLLKTEKSSLNVYDMSIEGLKLVKECIETCDNELDVNPEVIIYGKVCRQRRNVGFYSDVSNGYMISNTIRKPKPMKTCLVKLLEYVNTKFNYDFNGILINKYSNGEDYISKHSDTGTKLDASAGIIGISYGTVRKFRVRDKKTNKIVIDIPTNSKKIIQMAGDFQEEFTHEIPVEKKVKDCRYSLTFRRYTK